MTTKNGIVVTLLDKNTGQCYKLCTKFTDLKEKFIIDLQKLLKEKKEYILSWHVISKKYNKKTDLVDIISDINKSDTIPNDQINNILKYMKVIPQLSFFPKDIWTKALEGKLSEDDKKKIKTFEWKDNSDVHDMMNWIRIQLNEQLGSSSSNKKNFMYY